MEQFSFPIPDTLIARLVPLVLELDFRSGEELRLKVREGAALLAEGSSELKSVNTIALGHNLFRSSWKDRDGAMAVLVGDLDTMKAHIGISLPDASFYSFSGSLFFSEWDLEPNESASMDEANVLEASLLFDYGKFSLLMKFSGQEDVRIIPQGGLVAGELPFWVRVNTIVVRPGVYLITYPEAPNKGVVHVLDLILGKAYTSIMVSNSRLIHMEAVLVPLK